MKHLNFWIYFIITFSFLSIEEIIPQCNGDDCLGCDASREKLQLRKNNNWLIKLIH